MMKNTTLVTFDIFNTDYKSYNREPESMTIFVTRQLRVTLDSICNSCHVSIFYDPNVYEAFLSLLSFKYVFSSCLSLYLLFLSAKYISLFEMNKYIDPEINEPMGSLKG